MSGSSKQPTSGRLPPKISGRGDRPTATPAAPKKVPLPSVLRYPKLYSLKTCEPLLKNRMIYIIRHYGSEGISILVLREPKEDKVTVLCGDWYGNNLDLDGDATSPLIQAALVFVQEDLKLFMQAMQIINIRQAQFFLAVKDGQLTLVDMQLSLNKMAGPGFIHQLFGKAYRTQEIIKTEGMDDRSLEYVEKGTGSYEGDLIIKPSLFKTFSPTADEQIVPLYAEVRR